MTWLTLLIISITAYSIGVLLQRIILKEHASDPVADSIVSNLIAGILLILYAVLNGVSFDGLDDVVPRIIFMAIMYGISYYCMFTSLKMIEASEFTILFATRALWSIVVALLFLHETFSLQQIGGTILIIISVLMVSLQFQASKKFKLGKGQLLALIGAIAFGSEFINDAVVLQKVDALVYTPLIFIIPNLLLWLIFPQSTKVISSLLRSRIVWKLALLGVFSAMGAVTYFLSYQVGRNAAQIASINQTSIIIIVLLSVIFLKERSQMLKKILAAIISFLGVLLVK